MNVREGRESYQRTIAQLTDERAEAKPIVESLRAKAGEVWDQEIPPSWRTAGFVHEFTAAAATVLESDPRGSLALAQLALAIATSIPTGTYPAPVQAHIEGAAWKEIGTAHRYLSEYDASLRAYDAAHRAYGSAQTLALDDAIIDFARAIVFTDLGRYDEALDMLKKAEPLFRGFEDKRRLVQVTSLTGIIYLKQQRLHEARSTFQSALGEVPADDLQTHASLCQNLGIACMELGDVNNAILMLHRARQMIVEMGQTVELTRCDWNITRILLLKGQFAEAAPMLKRARAFFLEKRMPEEAGLTGLDLADALIVLDDLEEARKLVALVLNEFSAAKLSDRALTALAYLRDVLPTTPKPTHAVRHVRQYLDRLRDEPALLFLPLAE